MFGSSITTVDELIDLLEEHRGKTLRAAVQPSYPMGASVVGVAVKERDTVIDVETDEEVPDEDDENAGSLYIVISDHEDYSATREMWEAW